MVHRTYRRFRPGWKNDTSRAHGTIDPSPVKAFVSGDLLATLGARNFDDSHGLFDWTVPRQRKKERKSRGLQILYPDRCRNRASSFLERRDLLEWLK